MEQDITLYNQETPVQYSKLQEYDPSEFSGRKYQAVGARFIDKEFENIRFRNGRYENCHFENCKFVSAGLSGTHFFSCDLDDIEINDSNLQFCDFSQNCKLQGINRTSEICGCNLSQSMFHNSELKNIHFLGTTISQARFINSGLEDVVWDSCTLQDNIFDNITMKNISLVGCNLEYSSFKNVRLNNAKLPLHQIPYSFGLLESLKCYPNDILINAVSTKHKPLNAKNYLDLLPDLFSYYLDMNEYFPAINIALFNGDYTRANELIDIGLPYYIQSNDFRKIKGICNLIANSPFYNFHDKTQLYFKLVEYYNRINASEYERYQYSLHINDIKTILTGYDDTAPMAQLYLKTNITSEDTDSLGVFYQLIEQCLGDYGISTEDYTTEIRHNSDPLSFWITILQNDPKTIIQAVGIVISVITANPIYLQTALDILGNMATIGSFAMQIGQKLKNKKTDVQNYSKVAAKDIQYIKHKNTVLQNKKISVDITLPFFNFSYQNEQLYKSQN